MKRQSNPPPFRAAAAQEKSIIPWPIRARRAGGCSSEGAERDPHRHVAGVEQDARGDGGERPASRRQHRERSELG